jgi:hypothetical protein
LLRSKEDTKLGIDDIECRMYNRKCAATHSYSKSNVDWLGEIDPGQEEMSTEGLEKELLHSNAMWRRWSDL